MFTTEAPRPVVIWNTEHDDEPRPVRIIPHTDTFPLNPHEVALPADTHPLTWEHYHYDIATWGITDAMLSYLRDTLGGEWDIIHTGGGCTAFTVSGLIGLRKVECLVTGAEAEHPVLGWTAGIAVGFYDAEHGDELGDVDTYGTEDRTGEPMPADTMRQHIETTFARVGFTPTPVLI